MTRKRLKAFEIEKMENTNFVAVPFGTAVVQGPCEGSCGASICGCTPQGACTGTCGCTIDACTGTCACGISALCCITNGN